jgi:hypothetical protein
VTFLKIDRSLSVESINNYISYLEKAFISTAVSGMTCKARHPENQEKINMPTPL